MQDTPAQDGKSKLFFFFQNNGPLDAHVWPRPHEIWRPKSSVKLAGVSNLYSSLLRDGRHIADSILFADNFKY